MNKNKGRSLLEIDHTIKALEGLLERRRGEFESIGVEKAKELLREHGIRRDFDGFLSPRVRAVPANQLEKILLEQLFALRVEHDQFIVKMLEERVSDQNEKPKPPSRSSRHMPQRPWIRTKYLELRPGYTTANKCRARITYLYEKEFGERLRKLYPDTDGTISDKTIRNYVEDL